MADDLTDRLTDAMTDRLTDAMTDRLTDAMTDRAAPHCYRYPARIFLPASPGPPWMPFFPLYSPSPRTLCYLSFSICSLHLAAESSWWWFAVRLFSNFKHNRIKVLVNEQCRMTWTTQNQPKTSITYKTYYVVAWSTTFLRLHQLFIPPTPTIRRAYPDHWFNCPK